MRKPWGDGFSKSRSRSIMVRLETLQSVYTVRAVRSITIEFENSYFGCPFSPDPLMYWSLVDLLVHFIFPQRVYCLINRKISLNVNGLKFSFFYCQTNLGRKHASTKFDHLHSIASPYYWTIMGRISSTHIFWTSRKRQLYLL